MITPDYVKMMASYNQWMNSRLYELCANLSEEELKRDRMAFFKSIFAESQPARRQGMDVAV